MPPPTREQSIISISSSESREETLELAYPADLPPAGEITDMTKPMRLVVWFDVSITWTLCMEETLTDSSIQNLEEPARLTVYPRCCEDEGDIIHLHLRDYSSVLGSIGFDTSIRGRLYLVEHARWINYDWSIPLPLARANTILYIRSTGVSVGSPDEFLDMFF